MGHAVEAVGHRDVVVDMHARPAPEADLVRADGQRLKCGLVELCEEVGAGVISPLHPATVERGKEWRNGLVDLGEREELPIAQGSKDAFLHDLYTGFDLGFVARLYDPGGEDGGSIIGGHLFVGALDIRLVTAGLGDAGFEVVADESRKLSGRRRRRKRACESRSSRERIG